MTKEKIVETAEKYLLQKEIAGNKFEDNSPLGRLLHEAGQKDGEAWCAYFAEGVFCEALPEKNKELRKLFSASAVQTFENFKDAAYLISELPHKGCLVIWQRYAAGKKTWQGHSGIVISANPDGSFTTIEGNTNGVGSREGDSVQKKIRWKKWNPDGLNVLGFVEIL